MTTTLAATTAATPPPTEEPSTGAQWIVRRLGDLGVTTGYPGGAIMPLYDALYDGGIRHVLTRHKQGPRSPRSDTHAQPARWESASPPPAPAPGIPTTTTAKALAVRTGGTSWNPGAAEVLRQMREHLEELRRQSVETINDWSRSG